jgi:hypothetical protein
MTITNFAKRLFFTALFAILLSGGVYAQKRAAIKTNIPHWGTLSPNIGAEIAFMHRYSFEVTTGFNPFTFSDNRQWQHWIVHTELRYWVYEAFNAHFFGLHYVGGTYNVGGINLRMSTFERLRDHRIEGSVNGVGISYGYSWIIGNRLVLEATIGGGFARFNYDLYPLGSVGGEGRRGVRNYFGPTKGGVSIVYVF